jgi:hypothetical protein
MVPVRDTEAWVNGFAGESAVVGEGNSLPNIHGVFGSHSGTYPLPNRVDGRFSVKLSLHPRPVTALVLNCPHPQQGFPTLLGVLPLGLRGLAFGLIYRHLSSTKRASTARCCTCHRRARSRRDGPRCRIARRRTRALQARPAPLSNSPRRNAGTSRETATEARCT